MWNPLLDMLFHEQVSGIFEAFVVEIELAKIALSCHFALDLLCYKEGAYDSTWEFIGHHCPRNFFLLSGTISTSATSWFPCDWRSRYNILLLSWYGDCSSPRNVHICMMLLSFYFTSWTWNRPHKYGIVPICGYGLVTLGEFGAVALRENIPGIFLRLRAGGYQLVHGQGSQCSWSLHLSFITIEHSCQLEKIPAWDLTKVRSKKEVIDEARTKGAKVHFASPDGHLSYEECRSGGKAPKIRRSSCTPRRYCERWFWILCSIHRTRIFSISNDSSKSHEYHLKTAWLRRTSSWCSIFLYPGENGRCSEIVENSQIGVSRHLDSSPTTQMAQIMVQCGRSSRFSCAKSLRSSFGRTVMRKAIWEKSSFEVRLG